MKDWKKEKASIVDDIKSFINSPELESIKNSIVKIQKKIDKIPTRELHGGDNFTQLVVAFSNMMSWSSEFNWNRYMTKSNDLFEKLK